MKPIATFFAMLLIGFTINLSAQNAPVSTLGVVNTNAITATVSVKVTGFTDITSCDLKILYDQTICTPTSVTLGSGIGGSLIGVNLTIPGQIRLGWLGSPKLTLADGTTFFNISFNKVSFGTSALSFDDDQSGTGCQYYVSLGPLIDAPNSTYYKSGSLTFNSNAPVITAPALILCPNTAVNIPITVANFNNIGAVSLKLQYNSAILTFNKSTTETNNSGFTFGNTNPGEIIISWINTDINGLTLADNSVFFTLNFTYPSAGGTSALTWVNSGIDGVFSGPGGVPLELTDTPTGDFYKNGSVTGPTSSQKLWTGNTSNAWYTSGNWCPSGPPSSSQDAIIPATPSGNRMPTIPVNILGYDCVCKDLIMESGTTLTIYSNSTRSGTLRVLGNASGTGKVTYERLFNVLYDLNDPDLPNIYDWHYFSSPVGNVTSGTQSKITNIYPWNEVTGTWGSPLSNVTQLENGRGYNLDQDPLSDGYVSFTGSIVSSASVVATSPYSTDYGTGYPADPGSWTDYNARTTRNPFGGGGWTLLGNPFTSAMSIPYFLNVNDGDGSVATNNFDPNYVAIYIYDGSVEPNGQYLYRGKVSPFTDPVTGDTNPANAEFAYDAIQTGQGFFVLAHKNGVTFTFDKTMQVLGNVVPLKSANTEDQWPGMKLKIKYGTGEGSTVVIYNGNMSPGLDPGYDIGQLSTSPPVEIYSTLVNSDKGVNFAQQALPLNGSEKFVIPVGVDAEKGGDVIFSAITRPIGNGTFYLEDKATGTFTDLSKDTYTVTLPAKTAGTGRFYIHSSLTTGINPVIVNNELGVRIWNVNNQVNIEGLVSNKATGAIYDLLGRQLLQTRLDDTQFNTITVPESLKGVYLVKVVDGEKIATRKVVF